MKKTKRSVTRKQIAAGVKLVGDAITATGDKIIAERFHPKDMVQAMNADRRYIKTLRKLGASNYEIANALGIAESAPILHESTG